MRSQLKMVCAMGLMAAITAGCISESAVQTQEQVVTDFLLFDQTAAAPGAGSRKLIDPARVDMRMQASVAREFANAYLDIAKDAAQSRDALTAVVIGAAAFTGYGLVEGLSDAVIAERAVIGLAINEGADYASPPKATHALYLSARRMNCIATQTLVFSDLDQSGAVAGRAVAWGAISEVRIQLREGLRRQVPKYEDVFSRFRGVVTANTGTEAGILSTGVNTRLPQFVTALEACVVAEKPEKKS